MMARRWMLGLLAVLCMPAARSDVSLSETVAAARAAAWRKQAHPACVSGVVTLETGVLTSGRQDFYLQDATGGIFVRGFGQQDLDRGARARACGILALYEGAEPAIEQARVSVEGRERPPAPRPLSLAEALRGQAPGELVKVRGEVVMSALGETRDVLYLGPAQPGLRVYIRRPIKQPSVLQHTAPVGATVEVTGILMPEESNKYQIRLRSSADVALIADPLPANVQRLRWFAGAAGGIALLVLLWTLTLRRAVIRQTAEIRRLMVEAQESARVKSQFLANMSHEIRTPLNGIIGMTELALAADVGAEARPYLETARTSAEALKAIVNDVLDMARIERGLLAITPAPFELAALVRSVSLPAEAAAAEKGLRLQVSIEASLPPWLSGDEGRIRQVLTNLLNNAVKFTGEGGVTLEVAAAGIGRVRFAVRDTGIGIPASKQREIFEAFAQADPSITRQHGGAGLGLTISAQLVRMMGGELELESEPGRGSHFFFTLPLAASAPGRKAERLPRPGAAGRRLRVLVAEDNRVNQILVERLLCNSGHEAVVVADGAEAVAQAQSARFDLILMDVQMPGLDGLEATRQIRAWEAAAGADRTPIVAVTAHAFADDERRCIEAGMDGYIAKPFGMDALEAVMAEYTSAHA